MSVLVSLKPEIYRDDALIATIGAAKAAGLAAA